MLVAGRIEELGMSATCGDLLRQGFGAQALSLYSDVYAIVWGHLNCSEQKKGTESHPENILCGGSFPGK